MFSLARNKKQVKLPSHDRAHMSPLFFELHARFDKWVFLLPCCGSGHVGVGVPNLALARSRHHSERVAEVLG
jgi:hypothetical protein